MGVKKTSKNDKRALKTNPRPPVERKKAIDLVMLYKMGQSLLPVETIADIFQVEPNTLYDTKRYASTLRSARANRKESLVQACWHKALIDKDTTMLIWMSKQHLGYKEKQPEDGHQLTFNVVVNEVPQHVEPTIILEAKKK